MQAIKSYFSYKSFYVYVVIFALINAVLMYFENYLLMALPIAILILYLLLFRIDILFLFIAFMVPLSLPLRMFTTLSFDMQLPTEPLLVALMFVLFFKIIYEMKFDARVLLHPMSVAIYLYLFWMLITSFTSTSPVVSFKYFLSRTWFIAAFYFLGTQVFYNKKNIYRYLWMYGAGLLLVVAYSTIRLLEYGFNDKGAAHSVMGPFFNDHTSYGAIIALVLPVFALISLRWKLRFEIRIFALAFFGALLLGLILSYSRAAWLSVIAAIGVGLILVFKIKARTLLLAAVIIAWVIFSFGQEILNQMSKNEQDSSTNFTEHIQSIYNIETDASNLERINRWYAALYMFDLKPFFGWGPGTYMFEYAPFQKKSLTTIISTRNADMGNAHSEYLGPLSESGVLGLLTFLFILYASIATGVRLYKKCPSNEGKTLALGLTLGLVTYYTHGFLNNFLDTDKASALFWGYMAILVAYELNHVKKQAEQNALAETITENKD